MTAERWRKIEELYHAAQECNPADRSAFLAGACLGDDELRRQIEALLAQDSEAHILDDPASKLLAESMPAKLGPYEIVELIGAGGMGEVYKARDPRLHRQVAIKVLPSEVSRDPARRQRFEREARAAAALNHPNIVSVYDVGEDGGIFFIVTELVDGEPLRAANLSVRKALDIAVQIASGLAAAHQAGIVHRDLKPANILLDREGRVRILDFGLAKLAASRTDKTATMGTRPGMVMGTPGYMSPEQVQGQPADHRSDVFSFGLILYELLKGERAFPGTAAQAMAGILHDDPPELPEAVPAGVRQIVAHCLEKDPAKRFQSARDLTFALSALSQTSGPSPSPASARPVRRPSFVWIALGAIVLVGAFLVASRWLWLTPAPPLRATVLTSFVGYQGQPDISPDGNQFAFTWDADVPKKRHIFISLIGKGSPLRLTPEDEYAGAPSWSPDGQSIAYFRGGGQGVELRVMPALGGPSRRIASDLRVGSDARACWTPDAKWLLWSQLAPGSLANFIQAAPAGGGETHQLLDPPTSSTPMRGHSPALSPDGRELAWVRCQTHDCDLYVTGFRDGRSAGASRQLTQDHKQKWNPIWSRDGKEVIYFAGEVTSEVSIYRVRASGGEPRRIEGIGANAANMTLAAKSNRLLYSTASTNLDIRRVDLNAADEKPERFLSSTRYEGQPSYSPDGKRIAFSSNRVGVRQIWVADADGSNLSPLTSFPDGIAEHPRWSPDGQIIVFHARPDGNNDIYTVPAGGGAVKRLTDCHGACQSPAWSPDGKWIYFASTHAGNLEVFRMNPDGGAVQQITRNGGSSSPIAVVGKWLYYSVPGRGLLKMPADGGEPTQVVAPVSRSLEDKFAITAQGIYAEGRHQSGKWPILLYPFDGGPPRTVITLSRPLAFWGTLEVSPDDRWLLYPTADDPTNEIMLVENFR